MNSSWANSCLLLAKPLGRNHAYAIKSVKYFVAMGVCYLTGLAIYVFQCPERFKPGTFDIWVIANKKIRFFFFCEKWNQFEKKEKI